jgi:hypothetical protein
MKARETSKEENMVAVCSLWRAGRFSWRLPDLTETGKRYGIFGTEKYV